MTLAACIQLVQIKSSVPIYSQHMEFHTTLPDSLPIKTRSLHPCLLTLTLGQAGSRRSSFNLGGGGGGGGGNADDEGGLRRVISGGRRKSSFGTGTASKDEAAAAAAASAGSHPAPGNGPWYWRVQAGVNEATGHLVLLALSDPPNPVLTSPPGPLSAAMPEHQAKDGAHGTHGAAHDDKPGLTDRVKNIFRRSSVQTDHKAHDVVHGEPGGTAAPATDSAAAGTGGVGAGTAGADTHTTGAPHRDVILDQTAAGDPVPSPSLTVTSAQAHAALGTATAEQGWPGVINGQRLVAITVPLQVIDKTRFTLKGGKKNEATWLNVLVTSAIAGKAGTLRLEFDKDWLGAKGEAEILYHHIESAISGPVSGAEQRFEGKPQGDAEYNENWQGKVRGKW
ncbi:hypothetical protein Q5752_001015 [Cryptotrichosporon argae]